MAFQECRSCVYPISRVVKLNLYGIGVGGRRMECRRKEVVFLFSLFFFQFSYKGLWGSPLCLYGWIFKKISLKKWGHFQERVCVTKKWDSPVTFVSSGWGCRRLDLSSGQIKRPDLPFSQRQTWFLSLGDSSPEPRCCVQAPSPWPGQWGVPPTWVEIDSVHVC